MGTGTYELVCSTSYQLQEFGLTGHDKEAEIFMVGMDIVLHVERYIFRVAKISELELYIFLFDR